MGIASQLGHFTTHCDGYKIAIDMWRVEAVLQTRVGTVIVTGTDSYAVEELYAFVLQVWDEATKPPPKPKKEKSK
jgi:hypothetical protein